MAKTAKNKNKKYGDPRKEAARRVGPAVEPSTLPTSGPTSASAWIGSAGTHTEDVLLPSGNVARVRRVGPEAFLGSGIMPDTLTPMIEKAIHSKKGLRPKDEKELITDPAKLGAAVEMIDRLLCYAVVEPRVEMPPVCVVCGDHDTLTATQHDISDTDGDGVHRFQPGVRRDHVLYADVVDLQDKIFIMNFAVGGTRDLERFRHELGARVGDLPTGEVATG